MPLANAQTFVNSAGTNFARPARDSFPMEREVAVGDHPATNTGEPMPKLSEWELLARVAGGDAEAFGQLYDRLAGFLFSLAVRILRDDHAAEDVVQEVFVQIWEKAGQYNAQLGKPATWAATMLRNKAIDRLRASQRRQRLLEAAMEEQRATEPFHAVVSAGVFREETVRAVHGAVARLAPEQKQAIEMAFFSGLTQAEIAAALQTPLGTVKARIRRGMLQLRDALESDAAGGSLKS